MNDNVKAKIISRLDYLDDDGGRQLFDYLEFLLSRYNTSKRAPSTMQRIAEGLEDRLGPSQIADAASKGASQVVEALDSMISGIAAAAKTVTQDMSDPADKKPEEEKEDKPDA
jgi:hypothetical protein